MVVGSRLFIGFGPPALPASLPDGMEVTSVRLADAESLTDSDDYRLAYRKSGKRSPEAILLLHGSPGSLQDFDALARRLGPDRFVLVPDMLGFGASSRDVPDHSFGAQAAALLQLMDAEGVERVHVVGFSWGGGVAIELSSRAPQRVTSLVLVSAIGVQELELLGRYELNHLVHAFQHAIVVALDWAVPHFGSLSKSALGLGYTRSFLDSDQRPMRPALKAWSGPMLILHGHDDLLVPAAAAREHHRIVPQSRIVWIDGGHLVLWRSPSIVANTLSAWFADSDEETLTRRDDADPVRVRDAARPFDGIDAGPQDGLGWIVFGLLVFVASMVSEDLTCAGVGLLVATGQVDFVGGVAAAVFALVLGDLVLYAGGRALGPPLLRGFGTDPKETGGIAERLQKSGGVVVLLGRFVPGARLPTYVGAGALGFPLLRFTFWLIAAALLWAPFLVGLTALGGEWLEMESASPRSAFWSGLALILVIAVVARFLPRLATWKGRRLVVSQWRRLTRWEFWPIWAIYGPLVPSFLAMAVRHRSLRAPTLVNPAIPGGGLAGESKAAIEDALDRVPEHAIETTVVESGSPEKRLREIEAFASRATVGFPIVLKPDVGERGRGVLIAKSLSEVATYLDGEDGRLLAQSFISGEEFGLFILRRPNASRGELFSIARKSPRYVTGNGRDTIERLILTDRICSPMAPRLLRINENRLDEVPATDLRVRVTQLGTHSLGCRFLVGEDLRSRELEAAVERLSVAIDVDCGRYDVLAADEAALSRGEFKVVEFNGLTGEAAHMYDPRYGLFAGLRILNAQWAAAFEIGAAHLAAGRRPLSYRALMELVRTSRG
jgi:pimeloyl-ACP methyl ester carboxylesterase/membrane protein DedA with SNARE-associated domain